VGRYGGDEFIVILDSCGPNAYSIMERFRSEIANNCQAVGDNLLSITLSIGICYIMEEESSDQILRKADKTLYLAKQNGRNMVCMYE
jgi:diguanylate cyclase (GGDEF)-like protein